MCKEAMDELASGDKGWKDTEANTLILACFGMLTNHLTHQIIRPLWFAAVSIGAGSIGYLCTVIFGG